MDTWETRPQRVVAAAFLHDRGELLLAQRALSKKIAPGKFHLPGGHVDFGEHPSESLARELQEELGLAAHVAEPLWVFSYVWGTDHTVGLVYRVELTGSRDQLRWSADDFARCVWVAEDQLGEYLDPADHNFLAAKEGFARLRVMSFVG